MLFCTLLQKDLRADEKLIHRTCFHISAQGCQNGIDFENFSPVALSHQHMPCVSYALDSVYNRSMTYSLKLLHSLSF